MKSSHWKMPAEWAPHLRCWMAWPRDPALWGARLAAAQTAYAAVARAIAAFEPVTVAVHPQDAAAAKKALGASARILQMPLEDGWMRDTGPLFVAVADGQTAADGQPASGGQTTGVGQIAGWDCGFNGWGGRFTPFADNAKMARRVLAAAKVKRLIAPLILEGGAIDGDGDGALLAAAECVLNPTRNPHLDRADTEEIFAAMFGATKTIWLPRGLADDDTDGHIDNVARFAAPGVVLAAVGDAGDSDNRKRLAANRRVLAAATDARGRKLKVVNVPMPQTVRDKKTGKRFARSYLNFYLANGAVIMPAFADDNDAAARKIIAAAFPSRRVVQPDARPITCGGGGIHCITQQQPA